MRVIFILSSILLLIQGCTNHNVKLEAPDKPIAITVDVIVKEVNKALDQKISTDKKIF